LNWSSAVLHEVILISLLVLAGFLIALGVTYSGGHWVHGWILGCVPSMFFWLGGADFRCYGGME
jgi:hypothetical protein